MKVELSTPNASVVLHGIWDLIKAAAAVATQIMIIGALFSPLFAIIWWFAKDDIEPWLSLPEQNQIQYTELKEELTILHKTIEETVGIGPPPPVTYNDGAFIEPPGARGPPQIGAVPVFYPRQEIQIHYVARRRVQCRAKIEHRYWDVIENVLLTEYISTTDLVTFPVTTEPVEHVERIVLPSLPEGVYSYRPMLRCENPEDGTTMLPPVTRPPAYFRITKRQINPPLNTNAP